MKSTSESAKPAAPKKFRLLKWNERVINGDLVEDGQHGFKPWEGPLGFQADSFVAAIYRRIRAT